MIRQLSRVKDGSAGSITVEFKIAKAAVIKSIDAGFNTSLFGNIKFALYAKRRNEDWDTYFGSGVSVPSPGGPHASIVSWKGTKFWDGDRFTLRVVGKANVTDTLYVDVLIETDLDKVFGGGFLNAANWVIPAGKYRQIVTSVTLVNNTAKTIDLTPGANKRWYVLALKATNPDDVARSLTIGKYAEAAATNLVAWLANLSLNAAVHFHWPNTTAATVVRYNQPSYQEIVEGTQILRFVWAAGGASSGGTDADGLVAEVLEVDV